MASNSDTKSLVICGLCKSKFEHPILLPCGETICKKHLTDDESFNKPIFTCIFCNDEHKLPEKTKCFPINKAVEKLLEMNLDKLDLGKAHRNAKSSYNNLNSKLDALVHLQNDPVFYINEHFSEIINKIDITREQVLLKINDFYDKMINDLKYNQSVCEQSALNSNKTDVGKRNTCFLNHLRKIIQKWDVELNTIDFGADKKWKQIDSEAKKLIDNIQFKIDTIKKALLLNTAYEFKTNQIYIDPEWYGHLSINTNEKSASFSKEIIAFNRHLIEKDNYSYYKLVDYQELIGTWDNLSEFKQDEWTTRLRQFNENNLKLDETIFENLIHDEEQNDHLKQIMESEKKYSPCIKKSYNVVIWDNMWDFSSPDSFVFDYFVPVFRILNPEYQHEFKNELGFGVFFRNAIFQRINKETQLRPEIIHLINEGTKDQQLLGMTRLRKLLSVETNPPIQEVIDAGLVPTLVEYLDVNNKNQSIQFEAAWALTNIVSGTSDQTNHVVRAGAVQKLIKLINSPSDDISEQAIWALGNIAGDCSELRDLVIDNGAIEPLINVLSRENCKESLKKNGIWAISNFCRNKNPLVDLEKIKCLIPIFSREIESNKYTDNETLIDACWAISYLTDGPNERIAEIINLLNLNNYVELLKNASSKVVVPCLRIVGNIVSGDDSQTQSILDCGLLPILTDLLQSPKNTIRKEVCWIISNITAGTKTQIQQVKEAGFFPKLIQILKTDSFNVRKEAAWAIANAISGGKKDHIKYLYDLEIIPIILNLLKSPDDKIVCISIESLLNIFNSDLEIDFKETIEKIEEYNGYSIIEDLSKSENRTIYETAMKLLDIFENYIDED